MTFLCFFPRYKNYCLNSVIVFLPWAGGTAASAAFSTSPWSFPFPRRISVRGINFWDACPAGPASLNTNSAETHKTTTKVFMANRPARVPQQISEWSACAAQVAITTLSCYPGHRFAALYIVKTVSEVRQSYHKSFQEYLLEGDTRFESKRSLALAYVLTPFPPECTVRPDAPRTWYSEMDGLRGEVYTLLMLLSIANVIQTRTVQDSDVNFTPQDTRTEQSWFAGLNLVNMAPPPPVSRLISMGLPSQVARHCCW